MEWNKRVHFILQQQVESLEVKNDCLCNYSEGNIQVWNEKGNGRIHHRGEMGNANNLEQFFVPQFCKFLYKNHPHNRLKQVHYFRSRFTWWYDCCLEVGQDIVDVITDHHIYTIWDGHFCVINHYYIKFWNLLDNTCISISHLHKVHFSTFQYT